MHHNGSATKERFTSTSSSNRLCDPESAGSVGDGYAGRGGDKTPAHPMRPWNRDALVSLREKLQLNVLMETGLGDRLVEGGFKSRVEAIVVREQPGNAQQMGKLIDIFGVAR